jgi:methionine-S-sulfoxide reductase
MKGVVRTRVGYSGGTKKDPTYYQIGDHSETVQLDYDPERISYQDLLDVFWSSHSPTSKPWSRQYASLVLYHDDSQERLALKSKARYEARTGLKTFTEIAPYSEFYLAEGYHQKYYLRQYPELNQEFASIYPNLAGFVDSTATARVNGYVGGHGPCDQLKEELGSYGLSDQANRILLDLVCR